MENTNQGMSLRDLAWNQLRVLPAFRSLVRAMESRLLSQLDTLSDPVLDIGAGDGHFAQSVSRGIDVGMDSDRFILQEARTRGVYSNLCVSSATDMPFRNSIFSTIICNSVLEHIHDITRVIAESFRVLQHGGYFICSVPTDCLNNNLGFTRLLKFLGFEGLATRYKSWFARLQRHFHMYSPEVWQRQIEEAGFRVIIHTGYMSPGATAIFDLGHLYGGFNWIDHWITGKWVILPWRPLFFLEEKVIASFIGEDNPPLASCHFFVAKKM